MVVEPLGLGLLCVLTPTFQHMLLGSAILLLRLAVLLPWLLIKIMLLMMSKFLLSILLLSILLLGILLLSLLVRLLGKIVSVREILILLMIIHIRLAVLLCQLMMMIQVLFVLRLLYLLLNVMLQLMLVFVVLFFARVVLVNLMSLLLSEMIVRSIMRLLCWNKVGLVEVMFFMRKVVPVGYWSPTVVVNMDRWLCWLGWLQVQGRLRNGRLSWMQERRFYRYGWRRLLYYAVSVIWNWQHVEMRLRSFQEDRTRSRRHRWS